MHACRMYADGGRSLPFGFGRRSCPGASIGRGIVKTLVGAVVRNFRIARPTTVRLKIIGSAWLNVYF